MHRSSAIPRACLLIASALASLPALGDDLLTLRVNDAIGRPDGQIAVVIRTYEPRTIGQGQICLRTVGGVGAQTDPSKGVPEPLLSQLESFVVFSTEGDVVSEGTFDDLTQTALITFESDSGTINESDGPLVVLFFRLSASAPPGAEAEVFVDLGESFLVDSEGQPVPIEPRVGDLEIMAAGAPFAFSAEGDEAWQGGTARLGVATAELFPIAAGWAALRYDPAIAAGPPVVTMDPRHGDASYSVDDSEPGLVVVAFSSPDASLNSIPGDLISIELPISHQVPVGTVSAIDLDPDLTFLIAPGGAELPLVLEGDIIEVIPGAVIFASRFESGDLTDW